MSDASTLLYMKRRELWNRFRSFRGHSKLKIVVVLSFATGFWVGLFAMFFEGFHFLSSNHPDLADYVMDILLALFFLSLTVMLVFSNGIISFGSLFRAKETEFLLAQPLRRESVFGYKFGESILFSSWAFLFLGTPLMFAYGICQGLPVSFYLVTLGFFVVFLFIPAALGTICALLVGAYFPRTRKGAIVLALAVIALVGAIQTARVLSTGGAGRLYTTQFMVKILDKFQFSQSPIMPSYWVAEGIAAAREQDWKGVAFYFNLILSNSIFLCWLAGMIARRSYYRGWNLCQGMGWSRRSVRGGILERLLPEWLFGTHQTLRLLLIKDFRTFFRDPVQWSQCMVFFGLLGVYFLNLRTLSYDLRDDIWKRMIAFLNLGATSLTLSTFTSRFVYPQLSLEGRRFWVVGMAPISRRSLMMGKFLFAMVGSVILSESLILVSSVMLKLGWEFTLFQCATLVGVCGGLSGLSVGLGAIYPNFREDNPSKIVSGFGGTLNLVVSLFFVTLVIMLEALPYYLAARRHIDFEGQRQATQMAFVIVLGLSAAMAALPLHFGMKAFRRMEI